MAKNFPGKNGKHITRHTALKKLDLMWTTKKKRWEKLIEIFQNLERGNGVWIVTEPYICVVMWMRNSQISTTQLGKINFSQQFFNKNHRTRNGQNSNRKWWKIEFKYIQCLYSADIIDKNEKVILRAEIWNGLYYVQETIYECNSPL